MENHTGMLVEHKNTAKFSLSFISKENILKQIKILNTSKAIQESKAILKIVRFYRFNL